MPLLQHQARFGLNQALMSMRSIAIVVAWSVCLSVCLLITTVNPAKAALPVTRVVVDSDGPGNYM